jgi:biopolymer transport protein ExbD
MNLSRTKRTELEIPRLPLVALIDVVFFLLLYFIMAGNLAPIEPNLETALRTDKRSGEASSNLIPQIVSVDATSEGRWVYRLGERTLTDKESLATVLKSLSKQGGVVVRVSGSVPVHAVAGAIQACKDAGFTKISYVPRSTGSESGVGGSGGGGGGTP